MKKTTKKTTIVLVGILSICLVAGNILFAAEKTPGNQTPSAGLIDASDYANIATGSSKTAATDTDRAVEARSIGGDVITPADVAFVSRPFTRNVNAATNTARSDSGNSNSDVIDAADLGFVGSGEQTELCEVDGVKIFTAELCVR